jgi:hypothetical protein
VSTLWHIVQGAIVGAVAVVTLSVLIIGIDSLINDIKDKEV